MKIGKNINERILPIIEHQQVIIRFQSFTKTKPENQYKTIILLTEIILKNV